ncbi:MAG: sigma-70 family RNA polymerase sigma factor [Blastocatellia bacterium]|nr:sigma-70 family RNA polymerase sigma factor [Blastocatellia bacterium]
MNSIETDKGRSSEFERAALPHREELLRAARAMTRSRGEAQDLVQEVYLQAWKSFDRFTPGTNCRAWLHKILFHVVSHHRRQRANKHWLHDGLEAVEQTLQYEPAVREELQDDWLWQAVDRVPRRFAEVVLLADVHELSYREIGACLRIPMGTVMSRLNRGRRRLRAQLTDDSAR